jgi:hypothetical protein
MLELPMEARQMNKVAILPVPTASGEIDYHAMAGEKHSHGRTAGEALDALTALLAEDEAGPLIVVQSHQPDGFFDAGQQQRLSELMARWRIARDAGEELPAAEQEELESLVEAELRASSERTSALLRLLG